jgi:adenine-specific DNA-methyltransferase
MPLKSAVGAQREWCAGAADLSDNYVMLDKEVASLRSEPVRSETLLQHMDFYSAEARTKLDPSKRSEMGQFLTPPPVAALMASMFLKRPRHVRLVDAGAGVGSLCAAYVAVACQWDQKPETIAVTAYEVDPILAGYLPTTFGLCELVCHQAGIAFSGEVVGADFVVSATAALASGPLFAAEQKFFNAAILNPPYRKINSTSETRRLLRSVGIETSNLYTAFLWLVERLLYADGELVAITPRSFCNGPYFRPFRSALLDEMTLRRIHVYNSRRKAFEEDDVLQENVILYAVKEASHIGDVAITSSSGPDDDVITERSVGHDHVVHPDDADRIIYIVPDELGQTVANRMRGLHATLEDLKIDVSTGRVVDFRSKPFLRSEPGPGAVPLIYPGHFTGGYVAWPNGNIRKPNALELGPGVDDLLVPSGYYVLVKRFTAKEERRRVVAAVFEPLRVASDRVGFENHLNYFHRDRTGLTRDVACGLAAFLNSSYVDSYFRQFSGHTQVNATDLRGLRYPSEAQLVALGRRIGDAFPIQESLDNILAEELDMMTDGRGEIDPVEARRRIEEALAILRGLGVPREQQNDRSALSLLALLDVQSCTPWSKANDRSIGITPMMDWMRDHYGVSYKPNTRETIRRQTMHQFVQMGLATENPDEPKRPINSPHWCYQIERRALDLLRSFGTPAWSANLTSFLGSANINRLKARHRDMAMIPVQLPDGREIQLTSGGQNEVIRAIIEEFCPRFTPGGVIMYLGDAGGKLSIGEIAAFQALGVELDKHGKMPDIVVHVPSKNWLVLIEAMTSHGPVGVKRHNELKRLFGGYAAGLVYVTAFPDQRTMREHVSEIDWETEVWVADAPSHMIHFNGERFLGPYPE